MSEESPYPDEAIAVLLGAAGLPEGIRDQLGAARGQGYTARCQALQGALEALPPEARDAMGAEQLTILSLAADAAAQAADRD